MGDGHGGGVPCVRPSCGHDRGDGERDVRTGAPVTGVKTAAQLEIMHFTDPACPVALSAEPVRLRVRWGCADFHWQLRRAE